MKTSQYKISYSSDEEIIKKIKGGETALFEVLIRRYNSLLYKIARSYGFVHQDAEDLMQETHVAAFRNLQSFRGDASYKTWLTKILLNFCYHKLNYDRFDHVEISDEFFSNENLFMQQRVANRQTEKKVLTRELARVLEESLQQIPLIYRSVFVLREVEGFNVAETAELLGITPVNVKVRLNRAKAMLQTELEKFYSATDLYEFNLIYCDKIVRNVFEAIGTTHHE